MNGQMSAKSFQDVGGSTWGVFESSCFLKVIPKGKRSSATSERLQREVPGTSTSIMKQD